MTITINNKTLELVEVPEDATDFWINNIGCIRYSTMNGRLSSVISPEKIGKYLEKEEYRILCKASSCTEEQAREIVEAHDYPVTMEIIGYKDYNSKMFQLCDTATESLSSIIRSLGMDENKVIILEKLK